MVWRGEAGLKTCLYSPLLMDGSPLVGEPEHDAALVRSWARFGLLILSLPSMMRNRWILPLIREHCHNATVLGYIDLFTSCPWLNDEAMAREPDAMTSKQRQIGKDRLAIRGDYLDITEPEVARDLLQMVIDTHFALDVGLYYDSFFATCPFPADSAKHAKWHSTANWIAGVSSAVCMGGRKFIINPSWFHLADGRMSERWPDLEGEDPIASFLSHHPGSVSVIFCGFDPLLPWPSPDEQERRIRYAAGCALVLDAYLCVGPSDLNWRVHGKYWEWAWSIMDTDLGKPTGLPQKVGGRWVRTYERGLVMVDTQAQTTEVFD